MEQCRLLSLCILMISVLLIAGCTQPVTGPQDSLAPVPSPSVSLPAESAGQTITPQITTADTPVPAATQEQSRSKADPDFAVNISLPKKIQPGTTILPDNHDAARPRIIEVNRQGEIVWEYVLPDNLKSYTNPGWDVEVLQNGNILTLLPRNGVYEINRNKQVVWKYLDSKVSHDADRLANGNTLVVFGAYDTQSDAQVKEIDPAGNRVWSWYAKDVFSGSEYAGISEEGWTHANAVSRLSNGNTLVSLRNFNLIAEIDQQGNLVRTVGNGLLVAQHDPAVLPDGNILVASHAEPQTALELDPAGNVVWHYTIEGRRSWPVRDANRLPNGNTLITESDRIIEVTADGQVAWQFRMVANPFTDQASTAARGFYKAERIGG